MIRIPAFNILVLGSKFSTQRAISGILDLLLKILYMASMSMPPFHILSAVWFPAYTFWFFKYWPWGWWVLFSGSLITVMGTSITTNASGTQDPTWECFVDNISIGWKTVLSEYPENNWIFCQNTQLKDGPHVLTVKATVSNQQTFWFDQIQYLPSSDVSLSQATLRIDPTDPAIQYSDGWSELNGIAEMTQTTGSTITFVFSG